MQRKIKLEKGLSLNKESIIKLQETQIANIKGGLGTPTSCAAASCIASCKTDSCHAK